MSLAMLSLSDSLFLSLSRTHTHTHIMIRAIIHHMPEQDERWLCVCFRTIMMCNVTRHTSLHPRPLSLPFTLSRNLGSLLHPASRSPLSDSPSLSSSPSSSRSLITLHYITLHHITLHYIRLSLPLWFFRAPSFATLSRSPLRSLSTLFPITGLRGTKGVEVRRAADGPGAPWRLYASQNDAAEACSLSAQDLSGHLNGWSGKATGDEPINGCFVRRACVVGVKRPRDVEGEDDGGSWTPQDDDDEIADDKEEDGEGGEEEKGERDADSLDTEDDNGDARPAGRLDPATLNGHTLPELRLMCRQVSDDVT